jgi:hypothetical protein
MKCGLIEGRNDSYFKIRSGYDTERASDELRLANNVRLRQPTDLPLRIMFMASYPAIVLGAPSTDWNH